MLNHRINFTPSRFLTGILILFFIQTLLPGQTTLCGGSLGSNIFTSGDFGSGTSTVYPVDPQLAPGFQYTTQVPPTDGKYTLTNDMTKWPSIFPTWVRIGDNSDDPDGYMMVVNASQTPGIFYEQQIDNVCENTLYEFSADAINLIRNGFAGHILPDVSFYINDMLLYTTGPIEQDELWHTYGFTFTTGQGQSTVKLTLRNNAPGGAGNDLALDNISFRACGPNAMIDLQAGGRFCENELPLLTAQIDADTGFVQWQISNDSLLWFDLPNANDRSLQPPQLLPGQYYFRFLYGTTMFNLANSKCRIISSPVTFEILASYYTATATVCEGLSYSFGDSTYNEAGFYQHAFTRDNECDSIVTLELILFPDPHIIGEYEIIPPSCEGAVDGSIKLISVTGVMAPFTYTFNDSIIESPDALFFVPAGVYTTVITNEYGCYDEQDHIVPDGLPLQIQTIADTTLLYGKRLELTTFTNLPVFQASWSPAIHLSCPSCLSTTAIARENITYVIEAETEGGCIARDSVTIGVSHIPIRSIPNVFTPNNDQVNDVFEILIEAVSFRSIDQILIFDRWGGVVYQQSKLVPVDYIPVWDGSTKKGKALGGVYIFLVDYTLSDGTTGRMKGDVTVIN